MWKDDVGMYEALAIIISAVALLVSIAQFLFERSRNRKEATIHVFEELENNKSFRGLLSLSKNQINNILVKKKEGDTSVEDEWECICEGLVLLEHFAVGINNQVYNKKILNDMSGNQIIQTYFNCEEVIRYKRTGIWKENNYIEFEKMVKGLKKFRKKKGQTIPEGI